MGKVLRMLDESGSKISSDSSSSNSSSVVLCIPIFLNYDVLFVIATTTTPGAGAGAGADCLTKGSKEERYTHTFLIVSFLTHHKWKKKEEEEEEEVVVVVVHGLILIYVLVTLCKCVVLYCIVLCSVYCVLCIVGFGGGKRRGRGVVATSSILRSVLLCSALLCSAELLTIPSYCSPLNPAFSFSILFFPLFPFFSLFFFSVYYSLPIVPPLSLLDN
ncbi:hypothetical protein PP707_03625 [Acetobacter pasteurianus]|nr:hypothetical protein [Acetobacter pasteurianus]